MKINIIIAYKPSKRYNKCFLGIIHLYIVTGRKKKFYRHRNNLKNIQLRFTWNNKIRNKYKKKKYLFNFL